MSSNRPDPLPPRRPGHPHLLAAILFGLTVVALTVFGSATPTGAQTGTGGSSGDPAATTTTVFSNLQNCGPGHIIRQPDCGVAPQSPTDPGGWLQVSLFWLISAAVLGIVGFLWWRSRVARRTRVASGQDPLAQARARGQGVRRSTRSEPVAETSSN